MKQYIVDAFTSKPFAGNPAVPDCSVFFTMSTKILPAPVIRVCRSMALFYLTQ